MFARYPEHDWVYDGQDSFTGAGMYHCKRCGKSDATVAGEEWEWRQIKKRIKDLQAKEGCHPK
jgi:hypothetical protein